MHLLEATTEFVARIMAFEANANYGKISHELIKNVDSSVSELTNVPEKTSEI